MSERWPGGIVRSTPVTPTGPLQNGTAPGIWTMEQAAYWTKQGLWPTAGNFLAVEDVFSTWLYTANNTTQTITNGIDLAGKGGLIWFKTRNTGGAGATHTLVDSARGNNGIFSSLTSAQSALSGGSGTITLNSNGFTINGGVFSAQGNINNGTTDTLVSWTFREAPNFFDVVTYTGNGASNRAISHSLASSVGMIIIKATGATDSWWVWHRSFSTNEYIFLNQTAAKASGADTFPTTPTTTDFYVGANGANVNAQPYVAYLFAHDTTSDGIIQCGSYTGNGSSTGPIVTLGWEPQWLLIKSSSTATDWWLVDNMRGFTYDQANAGLQANSSNAESSLSAPGQVRPLPTGFQLNNTGSGFNNSGSTYIYIAIRRGPMRTPTLGTTVFSPLAVTASTGTARTTGFPVDLSIAKTRDLTYGNLTTDRLRGYVNDTSSYPPTLVTSSSAAESTSNQPASYAFNNTGYLDGQALTGGITSVYWNFRRAPSFFDEVCYTGTGSLLNVNHNLGVAPELMLIKSRSAAEGWVVYSAPTGNAQIMNLNATTAAYSAATWNNTTPSATTFTLNGGGYFGNISGVTYVNYLFASCPGVSKVGSYTGTGTTQTINCGFTTGARFVLIKRTDSTGDWYVWDSARGIVAGDDPYLLLNSTAAEVTNTDYIDTDNSGFQISSTAPAAINANGGTFIYLAIS